ncbi:MAG: lysyl-tRNA synthetase, lysyl-tRNA synthetase, class [Candidatus Parcubacteria bacterium]
MREELIQERLKKLEALKIQGVDPYPITVKRTHEIAAALDSFSSLQRAKKKVSIVGRIMAFRDQGAVIFLDIADESGTLQAVCKKDTTANFAVLRDSVDVGDFIGATGTLFITKRGQKSVEVKNFQIVTKSIRPIPSQWFGIEETDTRLRNRYLDILLHPETKELFRKKAVFWRTLRDALLDDGFLEVENPVLETVPGGAEAEPFKTHHNALDVDFFLRISLELPLKKLLVAGYEKVFEIGRIFRNEGIDAEHLQDYTQLEFYWAYHDYRDLMKMVEKLFKKTIKNVTGSLVTMRDGNKIQWATKWKTVDYCKEFEKANQLDPTTVSRDSLFNHARKLGLTPEEHAGRGRLIDMIFKKTVRTKLIQPCFLINPPVDIEPLAKRSVANPAVVERFQVVAAGTELGKGFSELNDPVDQRERFQQQAQLRLQGDAEAQFMDESFVEALEYGMPPAAGFGVSERLFSVILDKPVRETVIFPLMRPKKQ